MAVADTTGERLAQRLKWRALLARLSGWRRDGSDLPQQARGRGADHAVPLRTYDGAYESPRRAPPRVVFPHP